MKDILGMLLVIFVVLKVLHIITWSWWLVLSPLWIAIALLALIFLITFIVEVLKDV